jgi:hypothetical protein
MTRSSTSDAALASGFGLLLRDTQVALKIGDNLIGRGVDCDIVILGPHVSRRHARLVASIERVTVEDLGSSNGVFVNGVQVSGPHDLYDGDRILVGTEELSFFAGVTESDGLPVVLAAVELDPEDVTAHGRAPPRRTLPLPSDMIDTAKLLEKDPRRTSRVQFKDARQVKTTPVPTDIGAPALKDPFDMVLTVVERMLARGDTDAAVRAVAGQLGRALDDARAGYPPTRKALELAARACLKLAAATKQRKFIDQGVELHLLANEPFADAPLTELERLVARLGVESRLLERYQRCMRERLVTARPDELLRLERILALA